MAKFNIGDRVMITGGFSIEDGFGDFYDHVAVIERVNPVEGLSEHYGVLVNNTYAIVSYNHLQPLATSPASPTVEG